LYVHRGSFPPAGGVISDVSIGGCQEGRRQLGNSAPTRSLTEVVFGHERLSEFRSTPVSARAPSELRVRSVDFRQCQNPGRPIGL
jgi:hypothetical protein